MLETICEEQCKKEVWKSDTKMWYRRKQKLSSNKNGSSNEASEIDKMKK